jgi:peptidoglycan/LPS O-acetylase OafA/YrhL
MEKGQNKTKPGERRYELDWLRALAVLLLIYFHSARPFDFVSF